MTPAAALSARVHELLDNDPTLEMAMSTDSRGQPGFVLCGFARRGSASAVIAVPAKEWDGLKAAEIMGFKPVRRQATPEDLKQEMAKKAKKGRR